jgi:hypothetical protein
MKSCFLRVSTRKPWHSTWKLDIVGTVEGVEGVGVEGVGMLAAGGSGGCGGCGVLSECLSLYKSSTVVEIGVEGVGVEMLML